MTKLYKRIPFRFLFLLIIVQFAALLNPVALDVFQPKLPAREIYSFLNFVGLFSHLSLLSSTLIKLSFERIHLFILFAALFSSFYLYYKEKKKLYLGSFVYILILSFAWMGIHFFLVDFPFFNFMIGILEIPLIIFIHTLVLTYFLSLMNGNYFFIKDALLIFKQNYGKIFFFLFLLSMGPEALPFDELEIYTGKYGERRAWEIIVYRNLIFDILFFPLLWGYLLWIGKNPQLSFVESFLELNKLLKSNRMNLFFLGFLYYLGISLFTFLSYYFLDLRYLMLFIPFLFVFTWTQFYVLIIEPTSKT